jgi:TatD DNase family protein
MLVDTHAHVNFNAYREDSEAVIKRALKNGVWLINVGSQYSTSRRATEFAQEHPEGVFAAVGLHPAHLKPLKIKEEVDPLEEIEFETKSEVFDYERYKELASRPKVVAIGEVGLDYYHLTADQTQINEHDRGSNTDLIDEQKRKQKENFVKHLELAKELNKPVIIHCREAHNDVLEILRSFYNVNFPIRSKDKKFIVRADPPAGGGVENYANHEFKGVVHSFSGRWGQAEEYFKLGFYIAFNGLITFARDYDKVIKNAPLERLLIETDCPYLTPIPYRGKRNEPSYVRHVAEKIAEIKGIGFEEVAEATTKNARKLFGI